MLREERKDALGVVASLDGRAGVRAARDFGKPARDAEGFGSW